MTDEIDAAVERIVRDWDKSKSHLRASAERELLAAEQRGAAAARSEPVPTMGTGTDPRGCFPRAAFDSTPQPSRATQQGGLSLSEARERVLRQVRKSDERLAAERLGEHGRMIALEDEAETEQGGGVLADNMEDMAAALMMPQHRSDLTDDAATLLRIATTRLRDAAQRARDLYDGKHASTDAVTVGDEWYRDVRDFLRALSEEK